MDNLLEKPRKQWLIVIGSLLAGIVLILGFNFSGSYDSDFLWHTVLFDYIREHKALPTIDVFSWRSVEMGYVETAHSWLGSILIGGTVRLFESLGMSIRMAGLMFTIFWYCILCFLFKRLFFNKYFDSFYFIVCTLTACIMTHPRVQNMSYCIFIIMYFVLQRTVEKSKSKAYIALPIMALLLANVHGGTLILYLGFIIVFGLCTFVKPFKLGIFDHNISEEKNERRLIQKKIFIAAGLSFFVGIINPYGIKLYGYFMHLNSDPFNSTYVGEWLPISVTNFMFWLLLAILLLPLVFNNRVDIIKYGIVLGFFILSFKHGRFINYSFLYAVPLTISYYFAYISNRKPVKKIVSEEKSTSKLCKVPAWCIYGIACLLSLGVIAFFIYGCRYILNRAYLTNREEFEEVSLDESVNRAMHDLSDSSFMLLSDDAIEYLNEKQYKRLFCSYDLGGPLIYSGFQSFIDSRADCFKNGELSDSALILRQLASREVIDATLEAYNFDAMIFEAKYWYACENYLQASGNWELDYEDEFVVVYRNLNYVEQ